MVTDNELLQGWGMSAAFHASMVGIFGKGTIPYLATQAFYGISLFEIINYIEHYGLLRQKKKMVNMNVQCQSIAGIITM